MFQPWKSHHYLKIACKTLFIWFTSTFFKIPAWPTRWDSKSNFFNLLRSISLSNKLKLKIPKNSFPNKLLRLSNKGLKSPVNGVNGDLYVEILLGEVDITPEIEEILKNLDKEFVK